MQQRQQRRPWNLFWWRRIGQQDLEHQQSRQLSITRPASNDEGYGFGYGATTDDDFFAGFDGVQRAAMYATSIRESLNAPQMTTTTSLSSSLSAGTSYSSSLYASSSSSSSMLTSLTMMAPSSSLPPPPPPPPQVLTHSFSHTYLHIRTLTYCSEGPVHLVQHRETGEKFVIKQVPASSRSGSKKLRIPHEAAILQKIQHHPNIIEIAATLDGYTYNKNTKNTTTTIQHSSRRRTHDIVTPFAELGDLHNLISHFCGTKKRQESIPREFILHFVSSMIDALAFLHEGAVAHDSRSDTVVSVSHRQPVILHRDIKPLNIFLTAAAADADADADTTMPGLPQIKLADFGLACTPATNNGVVGTPGFKAPEIVKIDELYAARVPYYLDNYGQLPDVCSKAGDFYAFGVSLFALIFLDDYDAKRDHDIDADILSTNLGNDVEIRDLLKACLAYDPEKRPVAGSLHSLSTKIKAELREWYANGGRLPDDMWPDPMYSDAEWAKRKVAVKAAACAGVDADTELVPSASPTQIISQAHSSRQLCRFPGTGEVRGVAAVSDFDLDAYLCRSTMSPRSSRDS